jgi:hypothetical protein
MRATSGRSQVQDLPPVDIQHPNGLTSPRR